MRIGSNYGEYMKLFGLRDIMSVDTMWGKDSKVKKEMLKPLTALDLANSPAEGPVKSEQSAKVSVPVSDGAKDKPVIASIEQFAAKSAGNVKPVKDSEDNKAVVVELEQDRNAVKAPVNRIYSPYFKQSTPVSEKASTVELSQETAREDAAKRLAVIKAGDLKAAYGAKSNQEDLGGAVFGIALDIKI